MLTDNTRFTSLHAIRLSMPDYREHEWMTNVPLYSLCKVAFRT
ncbi:MAG: hypothetical protein SO188_03510 [Prevotella sp.]|nr:hypothetical protein [Prevotella sp.]